LFLYIVPPLIIFTLGRTNIWAMVELDTSWKFYCSNKIALLPLFLLIIYEICKISTKALDSWVLVITITCTCLPITILFLLPIWINSLAINLVPIVLIPLGGRAYKSGELKDRRYFSKDKLR
jgi:hypothetical protein